MPSARRRHAANAAAAPIVVAFLLVGAASGAQQQPAAAPEHALRITAEVVEQNYCAGAGGVDFLHMRVRLRYANAGARRLIVYRGGNLFYQVLVSTSAGEGPHGATRLELRTTSARYATREPEPLDAPRPNRDFVTLAPGEGFKTEVPVAVPVVAEGAARVPNTVGAGEHSLWLLVSTWYESKQLGEKLRERWARAGHLWTQPVGTTPLRFSTEGVPASRRCPGRDGARDEE